MFSEGYRKPLIALAVIGLAYYFYTRRQTQEAVKEINGESDIKKKARLAKEGKIPDPSLPKEFIRDVKKMSKDEISHTIKANTQILNTSNLGAEEREAIKSMLRYLKEELKRR